MRHMLGNKMLSHFRGLSQSAPSITNNLDILCKPVAAYAMDTQVIQQDQITVCTRCVSRQKTSKTYKIQQRLRTANSCSSSITEYRLMSTCTINN